ALLPARCEPPELAERPAVVFDLPGDCGWTAALKMERQPVDRWMNRPVAGPMTLQADAAAVAAAMNARQMPASTVKGAGSAARDGRPAAASPRCLRCTALKILTARLDRCPRLRHDEGSIVKLFSSAQPQAENKVFQHQCTVLGKPGMRLISPGTARRGIAARQQQATGVQSAVSVTGVGSVATTVRAALQDLCAHRGLRPPAVGCAPRLQNPVWWSERCTRLRMRQENRLLTDFLQTDSESDPLAGQCGRCDSARWLSGRSWRGLLSDVADLLPRLFSSGGQLETQHGPPLSSKPTDRAASAALLMRDEDNKDGRPGSCTETAPPACSPLSGSGGCWMADPGDSQQRLHAVADELEAARLSRQSRRRRPGCSACCGPVQLVPTGRAELRRMRLAKSRLRLVVLWPLSGCGLSAMPRSGEAAARRPLLRWWVLSRCQRPDVRHQCECMSRSPLPQDVGNRLSLAVTVQGSSSKRRFEFSWSSVRIGENAPNPLTLAALALLERLKPAAIWLFVGLVRFASSASVVLHRLAMRIVIDEDLLSFFVRYGVDAGACLRPALSACFARWFGLPHARQVLPFARCMSCARVRRQSIAARVAMSCGRAFARIELVVGRCLLGHQGPADSVHSLLVSGRCPVSPAPSKLSPDRVDLIPLPGGPRPSLIGLPPMPLCMAVCWLNWGLRASGQQRGGVAAYFANPWRPRQLVLRCRARESGGSAEGDSRAAHIGHAASRRRSLLLIARPSICAHPRLEPPATAHLISRIRNTALQPAWQPASSLLQSPFCLQRPALAQLVHCERLPSSFAPPEQPQCLAEKSGSASDSESERHQRVPHEGWLERLQVAQFDSDTRQCHSPIHRSVPPHRRTPLLQESSQPRRCAAFANARAAKFLTLEQEAHAGGLSENVEWSTREPKLDGVSSKMWLENVEFASVKQGLTWLLRLKRENTEAAFLESYDCPPLTIRGASLWNGLPNVAGLYFISYLRSLPAYSSYRTAPETNSFDPNSFVEVGLTLSAVSNWMIESVKFA
uniref:Protein kinase domain-containing protein n=1 Tax=Macrostomum lignano TaxID=282301 RepID=A0A1I8FIX2_9PLAT